MISGELNVTTRQGGSFTDQFTPLSAAGEARNLTGYTATGHIRSGTPDAPGPVVVTVNMAVDGPNGVLTRTVTPAMLSTLPVGDYWYEVILTSGITNEVVASGYWQHLPTGHGP